MVSADLVVSVVLEEVSAVLEEVLAVQSVVSPLALV